MAQINLIIQMKISANQSIKSTFTRYVNTNGDKRKSNIFSDWYCGITNNPNIRNAQHKKNHGDIKHWIALKAKNKKEANEIETYYSDKGTTNSSNIAGATVASCYVYIFKIPNTKPKGLAGPLSVKSYMNWLFS